MERFWFLILNSIVCWLRVFILGKIDLVGNIGFVKIVLIRFNNISNYEDEVVRVGDLYF